MIKDTETGPVFRSETEPENGTPNRSARAWSRVGGFDLSMKTESVPESRDLDTGDRAGSAVPSS